MVYICKISGCFCNSDKMRQLCDDYMIYDAELDLCNKEKFLIQNYSNGCKRKGRHPDIL
ncbi:hypothetical protein THOM_1816 [Trachipleistophora hominis]|uniref:Uncharacterized protein n=1 Tax=Trachipleistophora hominis TaxID=72359 RepID=L7JVC3_TRAHO|nr:hypothetical protein THOM_1816 [Trachipleistophora hominis]